MVLHAPRRVRLRRDGLNGQPGSDVVVAPEPESSAVSRSVWVPSTDGCGAGGRVEPGVVVEVGTVVVVVEVGTVVCTLDFGRIFSMIRLSSLALWAP